MVAAGAQEAGIPRKAAPTIGIAVDHRRRNRSLESLQVCCLVLSERRGCLSGRPCLHAWPCLWPRRSLGPRRVAVPSLAPTRRCFAQENVNRLKGYKASLVVFPRRSKKPKAGDTASKEEREGVPQVTGRLQPMVHAAPAAEMETAKITEEMQVRPCAHRLEPIYASCMKCDSVSWFAAAPGAAGVRAWSVQSHSALLFV